ncbi:MAG: DUF924 domain-containing protein [Geminicoccaceae bacterium]|nr:DUF924 domain-containing protein [Geminicoccaceae bacterium]MCB9945547.1 DUF924 domain-containing protein [Geminicoccaceae bacterium]
MVDAAAQAFLDFWFDKESKARWFNSTKAFDATCREQALHLLDRAWDGELDGWATTARGALALVILLDQMPRNIFRGTARAFAFDGKARMASAKALGAGQDGELDKVQRSFLYMPFEHSEDPADQRRSVELFAALGDPVKLDYALQHQAIIERFGRFPHRNKALGRESTPGELAYLAAGSNKGFQRSQDPA